MKRPLHPGPLPDLPPSPHGITVVREPNGLHLSLPMPGRGWVALRLAAIAASSMAALCTALHVHGAGWFVRELIDGMEVLAALAFAFASPLAVVALAQKRLIVLTEGVLLLREGRQEMGDCLRQSIRTVRLQGEGPRTSRLEIEAEISPMAARTLTGLAEEVGDDDLVVVLALPHTPAVSAEYLAEAVARWAEVALERDGSARPADGSAVA